MLTVNSKSIKLYHQTISQPAQLLIHLNFSHCTMLIPPLLANASCKQF